jgi:hypothetical protein
MNNENQGGTPMQKKNKRSRLGAAAIVVGAVLSIGAVSGSASAAERAETSETTTESIISRWDGWGGGVASMRSGIRW